MPPQWCVKRRAAPLRQPTCRPQTGAAANISVRSCISSLTKLQRTCPAAGGRCRPLDTYVHTDIVTFLWAPWRVGCVVGGHARVRQTSWHPSRATSAPPPGGSRCGRLVWCVRPPFQQTQRRCRGGHGSCCHPQPRCATTVRRSSMGTGAVVSTCLPHTPPTPPVSATVPCPRPHQSASSPATPRLGRLPALSPRGGVGCGGRPRWVCSSACPGVPPDTMPVEAARQSRLRNLPNHLVLL